jgi:hypothetical protein
MSSVEAEGIRPTPHASRTQYPATLKHYHSPDPPLVVGMPAAAEEKMFT